MTLKCQEAILELQKKYPQKRSALIPALHLAQEEVGYLPFDVQKEVAELFGIDPNEVHAVVSFYDMFFDHPVGKKVIHVCKNLSCRLRGSEAVMKTLCEALHIGPEGGTAADGSYTVIPSECLGACDRAPMMIVGETVVGPCVPETVMKEVERA